MKFQLNWTKHEMQKGGRLQRPLFWQSLEPPSLPGIVVWRFVLSGLSQQTASLLRNAGAVPAGMLDCQPFFFKLV